MAKIKQLSENSKQGRPARQINQYVIEDIKNDSYTKLLNEGFEGIDSVSKYVGKKPDSIIYNQITKRIIGLVEWKKDHSATSKADAFKQLKWGQDAVDSAVIFIFTDGIKTICYNRRFKQITNKVEFFTEFVTKTTLNEKETEQLNDLKKFFELLDENLSKLVSNDPPIDLKTQQLQINLFSHDSKNKVWEIWQKLWLATSEEPLLCLQTFTEMLVFKILSDLKILSYPNDLASTIKAPNPLLHYTKHGRTQIKSIFKGNPSVINGFVFNKQDLEFTATLKAFEEFGDFSTNLIHTDFKRKLMEYFLKQGNVKIQNGQHLTPRNIINAMWRMSSVEKSKTVFDPACGVGGFVLEYFNLAFDGKSSLENLTEVNLVGYDFSDKMIVLAKGNFILHTLEVLRKLNIQKDNEDKITTDDFKKYLETLNETFKCIGDSGFGSLNQIDNLEFADNVITNPPFVSDGTGASRKEMSVAMKEFYSNCGFYKEGMFIRYIIKTLKTGGEGMVILPFGVLSRNKDKSRTDILDYCHIKAIISLPRRLFDNTDWKTYIVCFQKKNNDDEVYRKPVFIYNIENVGFTLDANRIECESDLDDLVDRYNRYVKENADSTEVTSNKCITISQEEFRKLNNWEDPFKIFHTDIAQEKITIQDSLTQVILAKERLGSLIDELSINLDEQTEIAKYQTKLLGDTFCFQFHKSLLGFTQKQYIPINTEKEDDIPIYTAKINPVAYLKKQKHIEPYEVSIDNPHISVASDGDGTAGTNIVLHTIPYYINTSRIAFEILVDDILPEYVFYSIQDIKTRYRLDYSNKCNLSTLQQVELDLPIKLDENKNPIKICRLMYYENENGELYIEHNEDYLYDIERQELFINNNKNIQITKEQLGNEVKGLMEYLTNIKLH